jgi:transposase
MPEIRKKYDREFREGAVRIVAETGKPIAQVARDLGVNEGTLGNWVARAREAATEPKACPPVTSRSSSGCARRTPSGGWSDVLKRSVVLWVKEATK